MKTFQLAIMVAMAVMLNITGCSRGPQPMGVSGQVTFDGKPIESGLIVFEPTSPKTQRRDTRITNGTFALLADEGIAPGEEFKVIIQAFKKTGKKFPSPDPSIEYEEEVQYLPERYNSASTLRAQIAPNEAENQLKFELTSH